MKRSSTPSFVLTLKLNTNSHDDLILSHRFWCAKEIYNFIVRRCIKQLNALRKEPLYRELLNSYIRSKNAGKPDKRTAKLLKELIAGYGLTEHKLQAYTDPFYKRYNKDIDSLTVQKIATQVWKAVEKVLYGNGKRIHFHSYFNLDSIEGKNNSSGIKFRDNRLKWNGLDIQAQIHKEDKYADEALTHRIKYCRIKRMAVGNRYHYYLELIFEGLPPVKHRINNGDIGIDIGTSTAAVFSEDASGFCTCMLEELAPEVQDFDKEKRKLQRRMDRSRRQMNPGNYNPDGTVKKGRKKWKNSNKYRKLQMQYKNICRKRAAALKQSHEILANKILEHGNTVRVEKMKFSGLAKRSRKTEKNKKGRFKKKKRFGKSIQSRAPALLLNIIDRKLKYAGSELIEINTVKFKASQYDHVTNSYKKRSLSSRSKTVGGWKVQRDLYSAFLICNSEDNNEKPDRQKCLSLYDKFCKAHDKCLTQKIENNDTLPSSMEIKYFRNLITQEV